MFTGLEEYYCICGKSSIKPIVAAVEAACNLINSLQWCHTVVELHCGYCRCQFLKICPLVYHCPTTTLLDFLWTSDQIELIFHTFFLSYLSDNIQLLRQPQKALYYFFAAVLHETCKGAIWVDLWVLGNETQMRTFLTNSTFNVSNWCSYTFDNNLSQVRAR